MVNINSKTTLKTPDQFIFNKIQENEARLRMAIESTNLGTWDFDPISGELSWSDECKKIFGAKQEEKIDFATFADHLHPEDKAFVKSEIKKVTDPNGSGKYDISYRIFRFDDGSIRWLRTQGKVYFNTENAAERFIGTVVDITSDKKYSEELERQVEKRTKELVAKNEELNLAQELAKIGSWEWDVLSNTLTWTKNLYKIYDLKEEDGISFEKYISCLHPEDAEAVKNNISNAYETKHFPGFIHRIITPKQVVKTICSKGEITLDKNGNVIKMNGTAQDISQNIELTRKLEQKNIELERSNTELASFTYLASHDLQEPLRKIQTFIGKLLTTEVDNISERGKDYFERIVFAATRMQNLIIALLNYSQVNSEQMQLEKTDLNTIIEEVKRELTDVILDKKVVIHCDKLPTLNIVPLQFHQLFFNLIDNAIKYSQKDRLPEIIITCELTKDLIDQKNETEKYYWKIKITDNGIGFEPQYYEKIFELFQRLHGKTEYSGTGIGLAICKKVVENHKGIISTSSVVNEGTTFTIFIPE